MLVLIHKGFRINKKGDDQCETDPLQVLFQLLLLYSVGLIRVACACALWLKDSSDCIAAHYSEKRLYLAILGRPRVKPTVSQ